jgi:hypothetical protein
MQGHPTRCGHSPLGPSQKLSDFPGSIHSRWLDCLFRSRENYLLRTTRELQR